MDVNHVALYVVGLSLYFLTFIAYLRYMNLNTCYTPGD